MREFRLSNFLAGVSLPQKMTAHLSREFSKVNSYFSFEVLDETPFVF